jgi:hypothetical protein
MVLSIVHGYRKSEICSCQFHDVRFMLSHALREGERCAEHSFLLPSYEKACTITVEACMERREVWSAGPGVFCVPDGLPAPRHAETGHGTA